ncbi:MAG: hypothetical protein ACYTBX_06995 [Planctomycetota bacterium]|jgi:hypothetical protein
MKSKNKAKKQLLLTMLMLSTMLTALPAYADEGLSPGFWKSHVSDWAGSNLPGELGNIFVIPDGFGVATATPLEALSFHGGPALADKAKILLRQAVASLLNAEHANIDYPLEFADVKTAVNEALASGDGATMLALEAILDEYNNLGGDLSS